MADAFGFVCHVVDIREFPAEVVKDYVDDLVYCHVPANAGVDRCAVGDVLVSETERLGNVLDVGEVPSLVAVAPDWEGVLSGVGLRHERDDGVGLVLLGAVGGENADRTRVHVVLVLVGL